MLLIVVNDPAYFLSHRLPIAIKARDEGRDVHVASLAGAAAEEIRSLGFIYHELPIKRNGVNPLSEFLSIIFLWRLLCSIRPDVLHLVTLKPVLYGSIAARFAPVKGVVAAVAGLGSVFIAKDLKSKILQYLIRVLLRVGLGKRNLKAIFQNPDDRDSLIKMKVLSLDKTVLIRGSGVKVSEYSVTPEPFNTPVVVTFAARLLRDKGVNEYVEAARSLKARGCKAIFQLVGDLDPANKTSITPEELNVLRTGDDVVVMGYREDIAKVFAASNLVVLPSYREGLPKILIEAAACGRAVVTTNVPGCRDAITPNVTGLLVPVRDAVALAAAMETLINDSELRQRMGKAGRELAENAFTIEKVVEQHMAVYKSLEDVF